WLGSYKPAPSRQGPMVRIHLPPAARLLRTYFPRQKKGRSRNNGLSTRDRWFESCSLQERVRCEPPWVSSCRLTASPESGFETPLGGQEIPALPDRAGACRPNVGNGTDRWWRRSAANSA